jgi:hypothetical protein
MSIGMAVNSGNEAKKQELATLLDQAYSLSIELGLWIAGRPFNITLRQVANQLMPAAPQEGQQDCLTAAGMEQARGTAKALIVEMEQDGGRTRIGNTPSCDLCGEQHSEERSCEEYAADRGWNRVTTIGQVMEEEIDARREALKASIQEG